MCYALFMSNSTQVLGDGRIIYSHSPTSGLGIDVLSRSFSLTSDEVRFLAKIGAIYVQGKRWNPATNPCLHQKDLIRIHLKPRRYPSFHQFHEHGFSILQQDNTWVAIHKIHGVPSHESLDNQLENAKAWTESIMKHKLWSLSRLDVGTSGVLLFAKNSEAARLFHTQYLPSAKKIYSARTLCGPLKVGSWKHWMTKDPRGPKNVSREQRQDSDLFCELIVHESKFLGDENEWASKIELITGRTHQIRAQLAHEGFPIIGDWMYQPGPSFPREIPEIEFWKLNCDDIQWTTLEGQIHHTTSPLSYC